MSINRFQRCFKLANNLATRGQAAVGMMAAFLILVVLSSVSTAQGTYEFDSEDHEGALARLSINTLPATELSHFDTWILLDPSDSEYEEEIFPNNFQGLILDKEGILSTHDVATIRAVPPGMKPGWMPVTSDDMGALWQPTTADIWTIFAGGDLYEAGQWRLVPEPSSHLLLMTAIVSGVGVRRRRRIRR